MSDAEVRAGDLLADSSSPVLVNQDANRIASDLSFQFQCSGAPTVQLEDSWERLLAAFGFTTVNAARVQHAAGNRSFATYIMAIDADGRQVMLYALPATPTIVIGSLVSSPPTRHDARLEDALLLFIADYPNCKAAQIFHSDNGPASKTTFDTFAMATRASIKEFAAAQKP